MYVFEIPGHATLLPSSHLQVSENILCLEQHPLQLSLPRKQRRRRGSKVDKINVTSMTRIEADGKNTRPVTREEGQWKRTTGVAKSRDLDTMETAFCRTRSNLPILSISRTGMASEGESPSYQSPRRKCQKRRHSGKNVCQGEHPLFRNQVSDFSLLGARIGIFQVLPCLRPARPSNPWVHDLCYDVVAQPVPTGLGEKRTSAWAPSRACDRRVSFAWASPTWLRESARILESLPFSVTS